MEMPVAIGTRLNICRLIINAGPRKPSVGEVIDESDGTLIHSHVATITEEGMVTVH